MEKALGSVAKSGYSAIDGVIGPGERVQGPGLHFCATPASDFVCGTLQLAAGMNLHVFTTGRGTPYGLAMVPVIKVSTRTELAERWPDLIDIDAGRFATGHSSVEEVGWKLFHYYLNVASGRKKPERKSAGSTTIWPSSTRLRSLKRCGRRGFVSRASCVVFPHHKQCFCACRDPY